MILPELGGRVHMAYDKIKQRHFVYYNQVVKPALVGLTGPWISGGIEFNWPATPPPVHFFAHTDSDIEDNSERQFHRVVQRGGTHVSDQGKTGIYTLSRQGLY